MTYLFEQADVSNKQAAELFKQMTKAVQTEANIFLTADNRLVNRKVFENGYPVV